MNVPNQILHAKFSPMPIDPAAFLAVLDEEVVEPMRATEGLIAAHPCRSRARAKASPARTDMS